MSSAATPPKSSSPIANADSAPRATPSLHQIAEAAGSRSKSLGCEMQPPSTMPNDYAGDARRFFNV